MIGRKPPSNDRIRQIRSHYHNEPHGSNAQVIGAALDELLELREMRERYEDGIKAFTETCVVPELARVFVRELVEGAVARMKAEGQWPAPASGKVAGGVVKGGPFPPAGACVDDTCDDCGERHSGDCEE